MSHSLMLDSSFETRLFIDGEFVQPSSSKKIEIKNPYNEEPLVSMNEASESDVNRAVEAAKKAFSKWHLGTGGRDRGEYLRHLSCLLEQNRNVFAQMESTNMGKPITQALDDVSSAVGLLDYYAGYADKIHGKVIPTNSPQEYLAYTRKEAVGVCCLIVPWNYPLMLMCLKLAPALACGCTVVLKPSEKSPLTALKFAHLVKATGIPNGVVNIISGHGPSVGEPLARHKDVNLISFTGSTTVGKKLAGIAAESVKRIHLELGGKSPLIIMNDADLDKAADIASKGLFLANTGQCCVGSSRLLVQSGVYDAFLEKLKGHASRCVVANPLEEKTSVGPLADKLQYDRVMGYLQKGKEEGATVYCGGERKGDVGYFVNPTIFVDVKDDMTICKEEIFGPVVCVQKFETVDEAVQRANDTTYGLGAGVCTQNMAIAHHVINRLRAGSVFINCYNDGETNAPFGGFKQSGLGREYGEDGLAPFLEIKTCYAKIDIDPKTFSS